MPLIEVTLKNFTGLTNGVRQETFHYLGLIKAAITTGHAQGDLFRFRGQSLLEAIGRIAAIRSAFTVRNNRLSPTPYYLSLGVTDKGKLSYCVGNTICALLAEKIAKVPWIMNLEVYKQQLAPTYGPIIKFPDYAGKTTSNHWYIFEAKGRTTLPTSTDMKKWKTQATAITHIGGVPVTCNLTSVALAAGDSDLVTLWDDPPASDSGANLDISLDQYFGGYYSPVEELMSQGTQSVDGRFGRLVYVREADLYIGLNDDVRSAVSAKLFDKLNAFADHQLKSSSSQESQDNVELMFPDGVILKLGPGWHNSFTSVSSSPVTSFRDTPEKFSDKTPELSHTETKVCPQAPEEGSPSAVRDELTEMVVRDLLGPAGGPDEELSQYEDHAYTRYLVGMLAPKSTEVVTAKQDELGTAEKDDPEVGPTELSSPPTDSFFPTAMGLSFVVELDAKAILLQTEWGRYARLESATQIKKDGSPARACRRRPVVGDPITLPLKAGGFGPVRLRPDTDPFVQIQGRMRQTVNGWVVTVFMVNTQDEPKRGKDEAWVFQPKMRVTDAAQPARAVFVQRRNLRHDLTKMDPLTREETETLEMLYRRSLEFAVGHGVSVHVILPEPGADHALSVETEFMPCAEVEQQTPPTPRTTMIWPAWCWT